MHPFEQCIAGQWLAICIPKDHCGTWLCHTRHMADNEHLVLFAEGHVAICRIEVVLVQRRMN